MKNTRVVENGLYDELENILNNLNVNKYMLVCGKSYDKLHIKDEISMLSIPYVRFSGFTPNPLYEEVVEGVELFNREECDGIVAVGGGSAIDVAKCIKLYSKMDNSDIFLNQEYKDTYIPLIAIPTTAGTGSESTRFAVIYYNGVKQSVAHESIIPDYALLDHSVLKELPSYQKKCTLLDALCQGIESWWSVNSTDESKEYSKMAVHLIAANMNSYIDDNSDEAAKNIMLASNYAGKAINITQTTAAHAMSYKLTSLYNIPHGHAVAVCLPEVWRFMIENSTKCADKRGYTHLTEIFNNISYSLFGTDSEHAIGCFKDMLKTIGINNPRSKSREVDLSVLTDSVNVTRLSNNPVAPDKEDLRNMYERILIQ